MKVIKTIVKAGIVLVALLAAAKVAKKFLCKKKCGCGCEEFDFDDIDMTFDTDVVSIEDEAVAEPKAEEATEAAKA